MRGSTLWALVILLSLLATAAPPVAAMEGAVLASGGGAGQGWASFRFRTDGAEVALEILTHRFQGKVSAGATLYDASGERLGGLSAFASHTGTSGDGVFVWTSDDAGALRVDTIVAPTQEGASLGLILNGPGQPPSFVGEYQAVLWIAGETEDWAWSVRGAPGASVSATDSGTRTFLASGRDFTGGAGTMSAAARGGTGATAQIEGSFALVSQDTFVGVFVDAITGKHFLDVDGPSASFACPCWPSFGEAAWGPGAYTFRASGAGAGPGLVNDIILALADARLPR